MTLLPPTRRLPPTAVAAFLGAALAVFAAGCGTAPPRAVDGLLVAAGGQLLISDGSVDLVAFDGPPDPVVAVTASGGRVVAATAGGGLTTSSSSAGQPRAWGNLVRPPGLAAGPPLMALSPLGRELALAVGELQGERFDLVLVDIGTGTSRPIAVERGLNGPPAWLGPATIAIDVIGPAGNSEIATIDVTGSSGVTDESVAATVVSATADGLRVAFDDPSGDVLVGDAATWRRGSLESMTRIRRRESSPVESLAISPDGGRLGVVRRADTGTPTLELFSALEHGWTSVRTRELTGDGPISIAWLR
jgi:hypothetical protein